MDWFAMARLLGVLTLFFFSIFAVFKVPHGLLWKPAVGATEWGHILAIIAIGLALPGWNQARGQVETALALVAAFLFLTPMMRAIPTASHTQAAFERVFGEVSPRGPGRPAPLVLSEVFFRRMPEVHLSRHRYREVEGRVLELDLYRPSGEARDLPVIIQIHGGSWENGDSTQLPAINKHLAAQGYAVAAINYRLIPQTFPAAHEDVLGAIAWVKSQPDLGLDGDRIVMMGRSAGGHLALLAAYRAQDPAIRGVVAYYPPIDLVWSWHHPTNPWVLDSPRSLSNFLGGTLDEVPAQYDAASPSQFVTSDAPPTLLFHGSRDELVFCEQSRRLDRALDEAGVSHLFAELPWATHGFDANQAGPGGQISTWAIERFVAKVTQ